MSALGRISSWRLSAREASWSVLLAAGFNFVGMGIRSLGTLAPDHSAWPLWTSMACGAAILSVLVWRRNSPSFSVAAMLFVINALAVTAGLFVTERAIIGLVPHWVPFRPNQLGCLVAALLAPSFVAGVAAIAIHAGGSLLMLSLLSEQMRESMIAGEPIASVSFALAGVFVLVFRFRQIELRDRNQRIAAEAARVQALAMSFLQIRDLMNTPLQTLELTLDWLKHSKDVEPAVVDAAHVAIVQLRELNYELRRFEGQGDWKPDVARFKAKPRPGELG